MSQNRYRNHRQDFLSRHDRSAATAARTPGLRKKADRQPFIESYTDYACKNRKKHAGKRYSGHPLVSCCRKPLMVFLCLCLILPALPAPMNPRAQAESATGSFYSSFEKGDPQPDWKNISESGKDGKPLASGLRAGSGSEAPENAMKTFVDNGPKTLFTGKKGAGWTGARVLRYSGAVTGKNGGYAYNKIFSTDIKVTENMRLSYYVAPLSEKNRPDDVAKYVSIDLVFSDGQYLHDMNQAVDHDGVQMSPEAQGKSGTLLVNQWNYKTVDIGKIAAGKTISRILVAVHAPHSQEQFSGAIDDVRIGAPSAEPGTSETSPVESVNILRGTNSSETFSRGNTVPAVAMPNGFTAWSPALDAGAERRLYPYNDHNNPDNLPEIQAFSLIRAPHLTNGERQSLQVMPSDFSGTPAANRLNRGLAFDRKNEIAKPNYYSVTFNNGIRTEMAPASHSAIFRFTFRGETGNLIFDQLDNQGGIKLNPEQQSIEGYSDVKNEETGETARLFFYATFDRPVSDSASLSGEERDRATAFYRFDTSKEKTVVMRAAVSLIGTDQAKKNLEQEIPDEATLEKIKDRAAEAWNDKLGKVAIEGASDTQRRTLYANLYRLFLSPGDASENTGTKDAPDFRYAAVTEKQTGKNTDSHTGAEIKRGKSYAAGNFPFSAQTVWPAWALLRPEQSGELINGAMNRYAAGLPQSTSAAYAGLAFSNAVLHGASGTDSDRLYAMLMKNASISASDDRFGRSGQDSSLFKGYVSGQDGAARTLADSVNDYATGNLAGYLSEGRNRTAGKNRTNGQSDGDSASSYKDDSIWLLHRAQNYVNVFNRSEGFFSGRDAEGKIIGAKKTADSSTSQIAPNGPGAGFFILQDGQGLANLYGGRDELTKKLDRFFSAKPDHESKTNEPETREAEAGGVGLFTADSPQSALIPYLYMFSGEPWKTQETVRQIMNRFYAGSEAGQGYLGDDTGAMLSGWYFFSAAGFFPLPGTSDYVIGAPYFEKMTVHLDNGHDLIINAPGVSDKNRYIQNVLFNGRPLEATTIAHDRLAKGGTLTFVMGAEPSDWGRSLAALPDSLTPASTDGSSLYPEPLADYIDEGGKTSVKADDRTDTSGLTDNRASSTTVFQSERPSIQADLGSPRQRVKLYTLTSHDGEKDASDPKNWTLYGSKDGENWTIVDRRTNQFFEWRSMTRAFAVADPKPYRYYRLDITGTNGAAAPAIGEFELLGYTGIDDGFEELKHRIDGAASEKKLTKRQAAVLTRLASDASNAFDSGLFSDSIASMQRFVQEVRALPREGSASGSGVRNRLSADAHAIVNLLAD